MQISDIVNMKDLDKRMEKVRVAIVEISSLRGFLKKCKSFCEWMTYQGKIIFLINAGEKGVYDVDERSEVFNNIKY